VYCDWANNEEKLKAQMKEMIAIADFMCFYFKGNRPSSGWHSTKATTLRTSLSKP
jgi:hypothetical protein